MAKLVIVALFAAFVALSSAASFGGVKDLAGNYYDYSTGQYSSALTGKVYNTAPVVAPVAYAPHVAPVVSSPYYYASGYPYGASGYSYGAAGYPYGAAYVAPAWK